MASKHLRPSEFLLPTDQQGTQAYLALRRTELSKQITKVDAEILRFESVGSPLLGELHPINKARADDLKSKKSRLEAELAGVLKELRN